MQLDEVGDAVVVLGHGGTSGATSAGGSAVCAN
jgi:hypothetical protein